MLQNAIGAFIDGLNSIPIFGSIIGPARIFNRLSVNITIMVEAYDQILNVLMNVVDANVEREGEQCKVSIVDMYTKVKKMILSSTFIPWNLLTGTGEQMLLKMIDRHFPPELNEEGQVDYISIATQTNEYLKEKLKEVIDDAKEDIGSGKNLYKDELAMQEERDDAPPPPPPGSAPPPPPPGSAPPPPQPAASPPKPAISPLLNLCC